MEKRPVCFSVSAIEEIQKEFGDLNNMGKGLTKQDLGVIDRVLTILLNAGERYCKGMGIDCPPPLKCRPADLLDAHEAADIVHEIFKAIQNDSERSVEVVSKNA